MPGVPEQQIPGAANPLQTTYLSCHAGLTSVSCCGAPPWLGNQFPYDATGGSLWSMQHVGRCEVRVKPWSAVLGCSNLLITLSAIAGDRQEPQRSAVRHPDLLHTPMTASNNCTSAFMISSVGIDNRVQQAAMLQVISYGNVTRVFPKKACL